jgi:ABC-type transport system involved in multi-copper enzyme maturation permease subunit
MNTNFISPTGSIELDNNCTYSIDKRNGRSRETVVPSEDLAFYFKEYIEPKYGLGNINVSNVASFMKDLEMNWTKLTPELKEKVVNIMADSIFNNPKSDYDFRSSLLKKLNIPSTPSTPSTFKNINQSNVRKSNLEPVNNKSSFGNDSNTNTSNNSNNIYIVMAIAVMCIAALLFIFMKNDKK